MIRNSKRIALSLSEFYGRTARIVHLDLPDAEAHRLKSLGLFEGQSIELQKTGSPIILVAAGSRVAIAREIAIGITVEPKDPVERKTMLEPQHADDEAA